MILFQKDWLRYPRAIIDKDTRNTSFKTIALKLRDMGVKNHAWPLALHNPYLIGVDPFSTNITQEQVAMITMELFENPWYFFREIARAPAISGTDSTYVTANRSNLSLWWSFFNHITFILTQPRQTGKSFNTDILMTYLYGFYCESTNISLLTKDDQLRTQNITRLKDIYEELPFYLKLKTKLDVNNYEAISLLARKNWYKTYLPQSSPKAALKVGRGITTGIAHIDEPPFQPNIGISLPAMLAAMGAAVEKAKANHEPYGIIMTTTAGKKDDRDGRYIYDYIQEAAQWTEHFYDATDQADLEVKVRTNSRNSQPMRGVEKRVGKYRVYACFSHLQLGYDNKWLSDRLEDSNSKGDDANRDYFNVWTSGTESSPLDPRDLEALNQCAVSEEHKMLSSIGNYITRWYVPRDQIEHFMMSRKVVIGIDTSDASGSDDISFVLIDSASGASIAIGNFNETNLNTFAKWLVWFLKTYRNSTMIIERRSSGATIIDILLDLLPSEGIDPFTRLFNWIVNDPYEHKSLYTEAAMPLHKRSSDLYVRAKKFFGFTTSASGQTSRGLLYSQVLQTAIKNCLRVVRDHALIEQISSLVIRNGRIDHPVGGHDDLVIGWLLANWLLTMGKNLSTYGLHPASVMSQVQTLKVKTEEQRIKEFEYGLIRARLDKILEQIATETNDHVVSVLEQQARFLDSLIPSSGGDATTLDMLLEQAKQKRLGSASGIRVWQRPYRLPGAI